MTMSDITITFLVLAAVVVVFIWDRIPVAIVAIGVAITLWAAGILTLGQAFAGFGDPTVMFIASLFVVAEALDASGVTAWAGQQLLVGAGESRTRVIVLMLLLVALLTALITVNASVAALVPVVVVMAIRLRWPPSKLLMPLAFGAHAGSVLALTGTPVNVIISDAAADAGVGAIGFLEFAWAGIPLVIGTIAIIVFFGDRLLPNRNARSISRDFSDHAGTLTAQYGVKYAAGTLLTRTAGVAEVVIPPRSGLVGEKAFPGMITESGDLVMLAIQRKGEALAGEVTLAVGDTLLLQGTWVALDRHLSDPDVVVIDHPDLFRRQAVPFGPGASRSITILLGMILLLITGFVPGAIAALLAAIAVILLGVLTMEQAYRSVAWNTVVLVGGMIALSTAMIETGAATLMADGLVSRVGDSGPYALLAGLFVLTAVLGQLISNTATALIVIPIGLSAAAGMGINPKTVLMSVAVTSAGALLTPVATPANLMVMGPGGYRFGDYWKLGLPLLVLYGVVGILVVPFFWPF
jgi:di/tricarboxylate transporter